MNKIEITKHLKLPFQFDSQKLLADLDLILNTKWKAHFNKQNYEGIWKSIALYATGGDENNIFPLLSSGQSIIQETPLLENCIYFKEVLKNFLCPLLSVRLLNLGAGAKIKPHQDYNLGYENNCFRLHIPITTNPQVAFILDDKRLKMKPGECWYTNVNYTHSVSNNGQADRIHLVIDGERNEWSDNLFFSLVAKETLIFEVDQSYDSQTLERTIEELRITQPLDYEKIIMNLKENHIN